MSIPQIPDQMKRAPLEAVRAVFSGIGRILLAADRQATVPARRESDGPAGQPAEPARPVQPQQASRRQQRARPGQVPAESRWRSLDQTGNVRLLVDDEIEDDDPPLASPPRPEAAVAPDGASAAISNGAGPAHAIPPDAGPAQAGPADAGPAVGSAAAPAQPLADFDTLSLASIRARLRALDAGQLRVLAEHERRNAERTDVLGMLERRIERLESDR